jgi:hypothetical protein
MTRAVTFYADILLDESVLKDLVIDIEIDYDLDVAGHCLTEDELEYPREFTIKINPDNCYDESLYATLAHEMVHVKQYAYGELYNILYLTTDELAITFKHVWKGEPWVAEPKQDEYYDSPWEIEAYGRQVGLYQRWKNRNATEM